MFLLSLENYEYRNFSKEKRGIRFGISSIKNLLNFFIKKYGDSKVTTPHIKILGVYKWGIEQTKFCLR